jgi:hypothetical protein
MYHSRVLILYPLFLVHTYCKISISQRQLKWYTVYCTNILAIYRYPRWSAASHRVDRCFDINSRVSQVIFQHLFILLVEFLSLHQFYQLLYFDTHYLHIYIHIPFSNDEIDVKFVLLRFNFKKPLSCYSLRLLTYC